MRLSFAQRYISLWSCISLLMFASWVGQANAKDSLRFNVIGDESYGESVTAIALLDNGAFLLLQALLTNAGIGDEKGACRILYVPPLQVGWNAIDRDGDEWRYTSKDQTLKISGCTVHEQKRQTRFIAHTKTLRATITFKAPIKPKAPPHAVVRVDEDSAFTSEILIPWADVDISVTSPQGRQRLQGRGYLDHGRSNTLMPKVAQGWYRFRGLGGEQPILIEVRTGPKGLKYGWIWEGSSGPKAISKEDLKGWTLDLSKGGPLKADRGDRTEPYPLARLPYRGGMLTIETVRAIYRYEPAKAYGVMGRLAKSWVGDPITRTYEGKATWPGGEARGIIEYILIRD